MLLHGREDAEVALYTMVVVATDVILNHIDQFLLAGKAFPAVILISNKMLLFEIPRAMRAGVARTVRRAVS